MENRKGNGSAYKQEKSTWQRVNRGLRALQGLYGEKNQKEGAISRSGHFGAQYNQILIY